MGGGLKTENDIYERVFNAVSEFIEEMESEVKVETQKTED